jgi:hypothetical protein
MMHAAKTATTFIAIEHVAVLGVDLYAFGAMTGHKPTADEALERLAVIQKYGDKGLALSGPYLTRMQSPKAADDASECKEGSHASH